MNLTQEQVEQAVTNVFSKQVLPLFDQLLLGQEKLENRMDKLENRMGSLENRMGSLENQMERLNKRMDVLEANFQDFKNRQMTTNDLVVKKLENLEIEYRTICSQLEEYDNFFHDSSIPEEKKKSAYKILVLKVTNLESELITIKRQLQMA